jgi:heat shock protein HslJ
MSTSRKSLSAIAVASLALPLVLAGCSSSDSGETATSPAAAASSPAAGNATAPLPTGGAELADTSWLLTGIATTTDSLADSGITLQFSASEASGNAGVNTYTAGYTATADGTLTFTAIASTQMAGDEAAMALESEYLETLQKVTGYSVSGDLLDLFVGPDQMLTYTKG